MALPLFKGSLIRRDKCIPAFHKFRELIWDLVSSHARRRIAESRASIRRFQRRSTAAAIRCQDRTSLHSRPSSSSTAASAFSCRTADYIRAHSRLRLRGLADLSELPAFAARRTTATPNMQVGEASNRGHVARLPQGSGQDIVVGQFSTLEIATGSETASSGSFRDETALQNRR